ncbi:hypothetical protein LWF15_12970 [Kineosporia rhizophila]|uniref:DUF7007 domain-containing protein n=1 Tax=Kineosporia TaxID=49184 RepID=UPI001E3353FB|nr:MULTISPECIES: hypothetical protein [Kineosporia]MCE0536424.1 hypothetical protein [Kineosporia rhizophila]GLY15484.1 hypothetical protein Kisp01_24990 [Kineosporia sp. NBRC 101677]
MSRPSTLTPDWSPWGSIQESEPLGEDGILRVRTATSRGYFIPRQANDRVHQTWRVRTGWYGQGERDDQWAIVVITFPELFPQRTVHDAHALQRKAHPIQYATVVKQAPTPDIVLPVDVVQALSAVTTTATSLPKPAAPASAPTTTPVLSVSSSSAGVVSVRRTPAAPRKAGPVATQVWGEWHESVPAGYVGVLAAPDADPTDLSWHLVPVREYNTRPGFRFVVDPDQHQPWPDHP